MLLTLTNNTAPARDLGFLLRKHPDRIQRFELSTGAAHVFYPEATDERCTAALLLDLDPVTLVRGRELSSEGGLVESYVNDRVYAISSFMSVAIARVYAQALSGRSERLELVQRALDLQAVLTPLRVDGDELTQRLFGPLGYTVDCPPVAVPASAHAGQYRCLSLSGKQTLRDLLAHLYVLIPVLDDQKHYWVGDAEVEKLFAHGGDWLAAHPERELIARRYLRRAPALARAALTRLRDGDASEAERTSLRGDTEASLERPMRLQDRRIEAVLAVLREVAVASVADLGCGDGDLVVALARESAILRIIGSDVSVRELERATARLERMAMQRARRESVTLVQSSLVYTDRRLDGCEAATLLEVVEHIDPDRLPALQRVVFAEMRPRVVVVTTPNREYNKLFASLPAGAFRHADHRFEWTREEFRRWVSDVATEHRYTFSIRSIGDEDPQAGAPTQMAVFRCA